MPPSLNRTVNVGFGLALLILIVIAVASYYSTNRLVESSEWVTRTLLITKKIDDIHISTLQIETGGRGYILTGNESFLDSYTRALAAIDEERAELRRLIAHNAAQVQKLDALEPLIDEKLTFTAHTIKVRKTDGREAAMRLVESGRGKSSMDDIRRLLDEMIDEQNKLLAERNGAAHSSGRMTITVITIGSLLGFVIVALAVRIIDRELAARARIESELEKARDAALEASRLKSEFLANMSHEIRTPLNGVIGMTDLLLNTPLSAGQREQARIIKMSANALLTIISDILDYSKIEADRLELDLADFSLREALGDTLKPLGVRAHAKGLELAYYVSTDVPDNLVGDAGRLHQIIANLVSNAIKFTERGEVVVRVEKVKEEQGDLVLLFTISDTGIGIASEKQKAIFDAFVQADGSISRHFGGTGLGLSISSRLVKMMGGDLRLESEPGRGSSFSFTARFARRVEGGASASQLMPAPLYNLPVLVVDDNATSRAVFAEMLANWRMSPVAVDSDSAALEALDLADTAGNPFKVALVDAHMKSADGVTLSEKIKQRADLAGRVILILSPGSEGSYQSPPVEPGVDVYLTKPVKQSELLNAIMLMLEEGPRAAMKVDESREKLPQSSRPLRVLVAEDNEINQMLATTLLGYQGHTVKVVETGRLALEAFEKEPFDIILMDVQMPEMNGLEATAAIREKERTTGRHVPIIALTAHAMVGDQERCLKAGMDGYVSKPLDAGELFKTMESLIAAPCKAAQGAIDEAMQSEAQPESLLDRAAIMASVGGNPALLQGLVKLFLNKYPAMLEEMKKAIVDGDAETLGRVAHKLKGAGGYFLTPSAKEATQRLEMMGKEGNLGGATGDMDLLEQEMSRVNPELVALGG